MQPNQTSNYERMQPRPGTLGWHLRAYMRRRELWVTRRETYPVPIRVLDSVELGQITLPVGLTKQEADRICNLVHALVIP